MFYYFRFNFLTCFMIARHSRFINDLNLKHILLIEIIFLIVLKSVIINSFTWLFKIFILFIKLMFMKNILLRRFKNLILFIFF